MDTAFALFDTPLGSCGIAWRGQEIVAIQLPERDPEVTRARLEDSLASAEESKPPRFVQNAIKSIEALLAGKRADLASIPLDMSGVPPFHRRVYEAARKIPPGETLSYGELARRIDSPGAARAVGQALRRNPFALVVPCHRILAAGGNVGGFTAPGGTNTKLRILALEAGSTEK